MKLKELKKELKKEINKAKKKLQKQLNKGIIYENFGMPEYREIESKYGNYNTEYNTTDKRNYAFNLIKQFFDWCTDVTPIK